MTTIFPFNPTSQAAFSFQPILDGQTYQAIITSSFFGQRPYLNLYSLSNELVVCEALVGSPNTMPLQAMAWSNGLARATTEEPHGYKLGSIAMLTIEAVNPAAFNGTFRCLITGPSTFSYPLAGNPGNVTVLGTAAQNLNLVGGYFIESSLVYRIQAQQFEVSP